MTVVRVILTDDERTAIDDARGVLTVEAFVQTSAVEMARQLLATTTPEQRRGAVPTFAHPRTRVAAR